MKLMLAAAALAVTLSACASQTTTPIQSMSDGGITVAYVDGFAGTRDTDKVARAHCVAPTAVAKSPATGAMLVDETDVRYTC